MAQGNYINIIGLLCT